MDNDYRKMRKVDREKDAAFAWDVFRVCEYATIATINPDGTPYCVTLSPVVMDGAIYFHCAVEGQKIDNIKNNPNVCISGVKSTRIVPEQFATDYESAVAFGKCTVVTDATEKEAALRAVSDKYSPGITNGLEAMIKNCFNIVNICKITVEHITGKARVC